MHDTKRAANVSTARARAASFSRASAPYQSQPKANWSASNGVEINFRGNFAGFSSQHPKPPPPQSGPNCRPTFWTVCPFCSVKYQYYRDIINRSLTCQNCQKTFVAYDLNFPNPGVSPSINVQKPRFPEQEPFPKHGYSKVELGPKGASTAEIRRPKVPQKTGFQNTAASACKVNNRKRARSQEEESSESVDSESSSESDDVEEIMAEDGHLPANRRSERPVRRSARQRQKVSYKDSFSDDDDGGGVDLSERAKGNGQPSKEENKNSGREEASKPTRQDGDDEDHKEKQSEGFEESLLSDDESERDVGMKTEEMPESFEYPEPDFYDFDKDREEGCFSVGQTWAAYDTVEGMPRFYARIKKVLSPGFKLRITWLEPNPETQDGSIWVEANLPVSCGKFVVGQTEDIENRLMFSHRMNCEKGSSNTHIIYPNVGETWAIFKNWDIKWHCDPTNHKKYEYDFVEILSEYIDNVGIHAAYLQKVKGFTSLFVQTSREGSTSFQIYPEELYRFSHRVPSFRLTGKEREGVPEGCLELDPASIPLNIEEIDLSSNPDVVTHEVAVEGKSSRADEKGTSISELDHPPGFSPVESIDIPDSEFHNFDDSNSPENFQMGHVWALYADEDSLPKYYCQIVKVTPPPQFELHVRWLTLCMLPNNAICWENKQMPFCCGKFKVRKGSPTIYTNTASFSHRMKAERGKSGFFEILPEKGELWALYRHWNPQMMCSDLESCEYDLVEVIERNEIVVKVLVLERVDGFNSVFKSQMRGSSKVTREIPVAEILRFSHQVPAFQLAEERNGSLRGCWELDTAALPVHFFRSK
ncbi:hypothetical protein CRG98_031336 [Punica granatum]|nr:hypothetical protein CRG98_031336 [Punica granatum]